MHAALLELGYVVPFTPASLNLFMNIPWHEDGHLDFEPALSKPGDYVLLQGTARCRVRNVRLPAGHPRHQQPEAGGGAFRGGGLSE